MTDRRRIAVILAGVAAFLSLYAPQSLMPLLHAWLGDNAALAGTIVSAGALGVAIAAPFAGLLADRIGRRRTIVLASFGVVLPAACVALAQTPAQLIAARLVQGFCLPGIFAVTIAYVAPEWPAAQARQVTALYVAGTLGGGFSGRLISGLVAEFAGWRWGLAALALLQLLLALLIRAWLPPERERARASGPALPAILALLHRRDLLGAYAVGSSLLFALLGASTYVTLMLSAAPFSMGPAALSSIFVVYVLPLFGTPLSGRLLNRIGHANVMTVGWVVGIGGLALSLIPALAAVVTALGLFTLGLMMVQTAATSFVAETSGSLRATSVGLYVMCYYLGGTVGGVLPAAAWTLWGWHGVVLTISIVAAVSVYIGRRSFRLAPRPPADGPAPLPQAGGAAP